MMVKKHRVFISGTGTDVGKTYITKNIIKLFKNNKLNIAPYKPIETGCKNVNSRLIPSDAQLFYKLTDGEIDLNNINPYRFKNPISPNRAIKLSKRKIYIKDFVKKSSFFDENLANGQDYDLWLKMSSFMKLHIIEEYLGNYIEEKNSITLRPYYKRFFNEIIIAIRHRKKVSILIFIKKIFKILITRQWIN